ncbi:FAD-dependent monooxygenase [Nocardia terpenica]|uniref:FAD-dependent monooxygenase n=1 Tax=Nocardia terpenica TaxID=455432 RepID=UPI000AFB9C2B|nr:FAD-dependent monooxygenase [Nocardia terpenica]
MTTGKAVAVVGNGPVGQTAALLLARRGIPVTVLDSRPRRDAVGSKAICQQRDVLDIWESVGAGRRIADEAVTWTTARTFYRDRELFAYDLPDPGHSTFPPFVNISQTRTEQILDDRIAESGLIDVRWGHTVTDIDQDHTGVRLRCTTVRGETTVIAAYAIACTGAHSDDLRAALGVDFGGESFDDRFLICDIRADLPGWADERRFYFDPAWNPGRQVLIHPCPDSTFRIDWQVPGDYDLDTETANGALDARIRRIVGDAPYEIVWNSVYRFHSRVVDRMRVNRVLLAGDCAHLVSPFGARGLNSGVADAENAAWKLAFVLNAWAPDELLDTYHDERHAAALENIEVTTATMNFLVPHTGQQHRTRRETLERATTDPTARAVGSVVARSRVSRRGGGCWAGGGTNRLRALARTGFLLLTTPGVNARVVVGAGVAVAAQWARDLAFTPGVVSRRNPVRARARRRLVPPGRAIGVSGTMVPGAAPCTPPRPAPSSPTPRSPYRAGPTAYAPSPAPDFSC